MRKLSTTLLIVLVHCTSPLLAQDGELPSPAADEGAQDRQEDEATGATVGVAVAEAERPKEIMDQIRKMHEEFRVVQLNNTDPLMATRVLSTLMSKADTFRVEGIADQRKILMYGKTADVERAVNVLEEIDRDATTQADAGVNRYPQQPNKTKVFALNAVRAADAAKTVKRLMTDSDLTLHVEGSSNSLIVAGSSEQVAEVEELLKQLGEQAPNIEEPSEIKIFQLQRMDAAAAVMLVRELLADAIKSKLKVYGYPRTNSLIASGSHEDLQVIEAVLLKLDSTETSDKSRDKKQAPQGIWPGAGGAGLLPRKNKPFAEDIVKLRNQYRALQTESKDAATVYKDANAAGKSDLNLRQRVVTSVEKAFEARQQLQALEIGRLRLKLAAVEARIQVREMAKERIIARRLRDLIGEEAAESYKADSNGSSSTSINGPVQIEMIDDLDVVVIRGKEGDVKAAMKVLEQIESNNKDESTDEQNKP